ASMVRIRLLKGLLDRQSATVGRRGLGRISSVTVYLASERVAVGHFPRGVLTGRRAGRQRGQPVKGLIVRSEGLGVSAEQPVEIAHQSGPVGRVPRQVGVVRLDTEQVSIERQRLFKLLLAFQLGPRF